MASIDEIIDQLRDALRSEIRDEILDEILDELETDAASAEADDAPEVGTDEAWGKDEAKGLRAAVNQVEKLR